MSSSSSLRRSAFNTLCQLIALLVIVNILCTLSPQLLVLYLFSLICSWSSVILERRYSLLILVLFLVGGSPSSVESHFARDLPFLYMFPVSSNFFLDNSRSAFRSLNRLGFCIHSSIATLFMLSWYFVRVPFELRP